ncbi:uncharacterized protein LOC135492940 [Lineus longissimus]|uniref:uncharacterized protein LOC135492940 n=1 Tax=Lineus longissimus TaxID=88925 RepID=UPI00315DCE5B
MLIDVNFLTENGAWADIKDWDTNGGWRKYHAGKSFDQSFTITFDYVLAYSNSGSFLEVGDLYHDTRTLSASWDGWTDDDSQLDHYEYEVFKLTYADGVLKELSAPVTQGNLEKTVTSVETSVDEDYMYSFVLVPYDVAGNYITARRIVWTDTDTEPEALVGTELVISSGADNTTLEWQHDLDQPMTFTFTNRYMNVHHHNQHLLAPVDTFVQQDAKYDDTVGDRHHSAITNHQAVIRFETAFKVDHAAGSSITEVPADDAFSSTSDLFADTQDHTIARNDGDTVRMWIRAFDYFERYVEEERMIHIDSSKPIIQNLWLSREGVTQLAVHRIDELNNMTIEFEAYDLHSGIKEVYWKVFDNYTNTDVVHGHQNIGHQGTYDTIEACQAAHSSSAWGSDCYCCPIKGCFHQDFLIVPSISNDNGLYSDKWRGNHDHDYYLYIRVVNWANLWQELDFQITVDNSPPHTGAIHDGAQGSPEVDYQTSTTIQGHWDGFFDRESGIRFYQYAFGDHCRDAGIFSINYDDSDVTQTPGQTSNTWTAPGDGTYYLTVVAFNEALERSQPVCSDGVMIDNSAPFIKEIAIDNLKMKEGLIKNSAGEVWVVRTDGHIFPIDSPSSACSGKATTAANFDLYPLWRFDNGTIRETGNTSWCESDSAVGLGSGYNSYLIEDNYMSINWTGGDGESGIREYYFGIGSTGCSAPDILGWQQSKKGGRFFQYHTGLSAGTTVYACVKVINQAGVDTVQSWGPMIVEVTAPSISGSAPTTTLENGYLVTTWTSSVFTDSQDNEALIIEVAYGENEAGKNANLLDWAPVRSGGSCTVEPSTTSTCTAVAVTELKWSLHGLRSYVPSIRATNFAGYSAEVKGAAYVHDAEPPNEGIVIEITPASDVTERNIVFGKADDIDHQTTKNQLIIEYWGFERPNAPTTYQVAVGTTPGAVNTLNWQSTTTQRQALVVSLQDFTTYYVSIKATNDYGEITVTSDGVRVMSTGATLNGITILDGLFCVSPTASVDLSNHDQDNRLACVDDIEFQASRTVVAAHWAIPLSLAPYISTTWWKIMEMEDVVDITSWREFRVSEEIGLTYEISDAEVYMTPGRRYKVEVTFCYDQICFASLQSNGFHLISSPPTAGLITVEYQEPQTLVVSFEKMFDPDVPANYRDVAETMMNYYDWSLSAGGHDGRLIHQWEQLGSVDEHNVTWDQFTVTLNNPLSFTECVLVAVRGWNKVNMFTSISAEVKDCDAFDPILINPKMVIDAVGTQKLDEDTDEPIHQNGAPIWMEQNAHWEVEDQDYSPWTNILSAVWPTLRHRNYTYAVIMDSSLNAYTHYIRPDAMSYPDPCSLPTAIACGETSNEYVNVEFPAGTLIHGRRYYICIHAKAVNIEFEKWTQIIPEAYNCSDGVTVDLTAPTEGDVWIGFDKGAAFTTSISEMYVNWDTFVDVEEHNKAPHHAGIAFYEYAIGTTPKGIDIQDFTNEGLSNHGRAHGISLQNGYTYYASVRATDFVGLETVVTSDGITVDTTPPLKSDAKIDIGHRVHTSKTSVTASWIGLFSDAESGIAYYMWGIGSLPGQVDVMTWEKVTSDTVVSPPNDPLSLKEGLTYYVSVKAYNNAGLYSSASSWGAVVDSSSPVIGVVHDGGEIDLDYQTDRSVLIGWWQGFEDPHSGMSHYSWMIGTCEGCDDVLPEQFVGQETDASATNLDLVAGHIYYITVVACNLADMCVQKSSDGIITDDTPPIPGVVYDGLSGSDMLYQVSETKIGCKWWGFNDPESGIDHYQWWAGTTSGGDNVVSATYVGPTGLAFKTGVSLPIDTRIYITVKATNHLGLSSQRTSNGFIVDSTAPSFTMKPRLFNEAGSGAADTQIYRSTLKAVWQSQDAESHVKDQYISLYTHLNGELTAPTVHIPGTARDYTFTNVSLYDAGKYIVHVIACNTARRCTADESLEIMVDATPPSRGNWAIETMHAARLTRHQDGWMRWTSNNLKLSWLGFTDLHSGVVSYMISVGRGPFGTEMTSNGFRTISHANTGVDKADEGKVQTADVSLSQTLNSNDQIYITMYAINGAGLESRYIMNEFKAVPGGHLNLMRRCTAQSCEGDCVCAVEDQRCADRLGSCVDQSAGTSNTEYDVLDVLDFNWNGNQIDVDYTPSKCTLIGRWNVKTAKGKAAIRFEWSAGYYDEPEPAGIFDIATEVVWHNVGMSTHAILALPRTKTLDIHTKYKFFVRAWYSSTEYAQFTSDGVIPDVMPPEITTIRGAQVKDLIDISHDWDVDFTSQGDSLAVTWKNRFRDFSDALSFFNVSISSYPGGEDIKAFAQVNGGVGAERVTVTGLAMNQGDKYYSNVVAYNQAGLHSTEHSDGVVIDTTVPLKGYIEDGLGLHDLEYTSDAAIVSGKWHGFTDTESFIDRYSFCAGSTDGPTDCGLAAWQDVGLKTAYFVHLQAPIATGGKYYTKVKAVDAAGLWSDVAVSDGVTVDTTSPISLKKFSFGNNLVQNPSFESAGSSALDLLNLDFEDLSTQSMTPANWILDTTDTKCAVLSGSDNVAHQGSNFAIFYGSLKQSVSGLASGEKYRLRFYTSHIFPTHTPLLTLEGRIEIPGYNHVFKLHNRISRHDSTVENSMESLIWQEHTYYFHATGSSEDIRISTIGYRNGMALDMVSVELMSIGDRTPHPIANPWSALQTPIHVHTVLISDWTSVHAAWDFIDVESPIVDYTWAVGTVRGGTQLQGYKSTGRINFGENVDLRLDHNSYVYVTVVATNAAGLHTMVYSDAILVDLKPPVIDFVYDSEMGDDIDLQVDPNVGGNWNVSDVESLVHYCEYCIGFNPGSSEVMTWTKLAHGVNNFVENMDTALVGGRKIFTTVKCYNFAGFSSMMSSNGIIVVVSPPNVDNAECHVVQTSPTPFPTRDLYQSRTDNVQLVWTGFVDPVGIDFYQIQLTGEGIWKPVWYRVAENAQNYLNISNMNLKTGREYTLHVRGVNAMAMASDSISTSFMVETETPTVTLTAGNDTGLHETWVMKDVKFQFQWDGIFGSSTELVYEVTVGSTEGGSDIIQWQETKGTTMLVKVDDVLNSKLEAYYVTVTAINPSGLFRTVNFIIDPAGMS